MQYKLDVKLDHCDLCKIIKDTLIDDLRIAELQKVDPDLQEAYFTMIEQYSTISEWKEFIDNYQPQDGWVNHAAAVMKQKREDKAKEQYNRAMKAMEDVMKDSISFGRMGMGVGVIGYID